MRLFDLDEKKEAPRADLDLGGGPEWDAWRRRWGARTNELMKRGMPVVKAKQAAYKDLRAVGKGPPGEES